MTAISIVLPTRKQRQTIHPNKAALLHEVIFIEGRLPAEGESVFWCVHNRKEDKAVIKVIE